MTEPAHQEEAALMGRYCDGDRAAFDRLYVLVAPRILAYLTGLASDRTVAQDLLQQTFLKLHKARGAYVRDADPVPWIYTIAHRVCLDEMRRRGRARVRLVADQSDLPEPRATITGAPEDVLPDDDAAAARIPLAALDSLPQNQREALILTKVHGHSVAQAAMIAGTTPGAIKLRAHRAYVALRERFGRRARQPGDTP